MSTRVYSSVFKVILFFAAFFISTNESWATTYFPSSAGGNWNAGASWSTASCGGAACTCVPGLSSDVVNLTCAKTITATANVVQTGAITISGGTLIINSGITVNATSLSMTSGTLTINGTLNISGTVSITGGTYTSSATGTLGLTGGAQNISSSAALYNLNIAGSGNKTMLTNITVNNQLQLTTNNLILNGKTLTAGTSSSLNTSISVSSGKLTLDASASLSIGGTYSNTDLSTIVTNTWPTTITGLTLSKSSVAVGLGTSHNLTVSGAFALTGGNFSIGSSLLTLNGTISGSISGQVKGSSTSDLTIGGSGTASMYFDLTSTSIGGTNTIRNFTNTRTSNSFTMLSNLRIGGTLTEAAGSSITITTGSSQTLTIDGTVSGTAPIVGNANATLSIQGTGALGGTISFVTTQTLSNLTMNRLISGTANIGSAVSVSSLTLTFGVINNGSNIITVTGTTTGAISGGSSSSYVNGILARNIPPNTSSGTWAFPVGATNYELLELVTPVTTSTAGNVVIQAQAIDGATGGTADGTSVTSINTDNYWSASVTANAANLSSIANITLTDNSVTTGSVIARAPTQNGRYSSLGGTIAGSKATSTFSPPLSLGFFVIGTGNTSPLCGVYTVGSGGDFGSVYEAVAALNIRPVTCDVYFELLPTYPTGVTETFPITSFAFNNVGGPWKATFRPQAGAGLLTTSGDPGSGYALINVQGADKVVFDGRPGGVGSSNGWTIQNTRTASLVGPAIQLTDGATNDTLRYLNLKSSNSQTSSGTVFLYCSSTGADNTDNVIQNCDIGANGSTYPANGICAYGYASTNINSNISVLNNDIHDFIGSNACGILVTGTSTTTNFGDNWTITGNSLYRTVNNSLSDGLVIGINFSPSPSTTGTSAGNTISNNFIGGSNSARANGAISGTWVTAASTSNSQSFQGIQVQAKGATISGNTIGGIYNLQGSSQSGFAGIYVPVSNSTTGSISITGNTIGSASGQGKLYFGTSSTSLVIGTGSTKTLTTQAGLGFQVGDTVRFATTNLFSSFYQGYMEGVVTSYSGTSLSIIPVRSLFGGSTGTGWNITIANGIQSSGQWAMAGIWTTASGAAISITNNKIGNLSNTHFNSFMAAGIIATNGAYTITGDTIYNINGNFIYSSVSTAQGTFGTYAGVVGISQQSVLANTVQTISNNTILNLNYISTTASAYNIIGIEAQGTTSASVTHIMDANSIYGFNAGNSNTGSQFFGVFMRSGTWKVTNNMIALGKRSDGTNITASTLINGIYDGNSGSSSTGTQKFYHNSIYIGGTNVVAGAINTYAFRRNNISSSPKDIIDVRNNIFVNDRSRTSGTGSFFGIGLDNNVTVTTDYNDVYGTGTGFNFGQIGATPYANKAAWVGANATFDANSITTDPQFLDVTTGAFDLHIDNTVSPSPVDQAGTAAATITTDFDGQTRAGLTPVDIGANAFTACLIPTITLGTNPTVCSSASDQNANLDYTATTNTPTTYSITWSGGGLADVVDDALPATPIVIIVPGGTTGGTYNATLTVKNACGSVSADYPISVTVNTTPAISSNGKSDPTNCSGTDGNITLNGLIASTTYSVTYNKNGSPVSAANFTSNGGGVLTIGGLTQGSYDNFVLILNGCNSAAYPSSGSITLTDPATPSITPGSNPSVCTASTSADLTYTNNAGSPDHYNITWGPAATSAGFSDLTGYTTSLPASPITITVPGSAPANTYAGTLSVKNNTTGCVSANYSISVTVQVCNSMWVGPAGGNWETSANWSPAIVPNGCGTTINIPSGSSPVINTVFNSTDIQVGDITLGAGATITLNGKNLNVCGNWTGGTGSDAAVVGNGTTFFNSPTAAQTISASTKFDILQVNNTSGVSLSSNALVEIGKGLHLQHGVLSVTAGTLRLLSVAANNNSYIDDFTQSPVFNGSITGNVIVDRFVPVGGFNQHFISSPVNNPSLTQIGASGPDGKYITPTPDCDPTQSSPSSEYGSVFVYNDGHAPSGACMLGNWMIKSSGSMDNGRGYSAYLTGNSIHSLTGVANTGNISVGNLNNSGYPTVNLLGGQPVESGWNLVGNPYPSAIDLTVSRIGNGFQNQVQIWQTTGAFAGSWQPVIINGTQGSVVLAPFQGVMVRRTAAGTGSYPFYQSERSRITNQSFYKVQDESMLTLEVGYKNFKDVTKVQFNSLATVGFDDEYDANKYDGSTGRPTIYTTMNSNTWYAINTLPLLKDVTTVPVGLRPEANDVMTISAEGIESFDATTFIYLEDKKTGTWQNLREGAYSFIASKTDDQMRFVLHFTPPAEILTTDASCTVSGMINIIQPGSANWNYTLTDAANILVAAGTLNVSSPVSVNTVPGVYTLSLKDNNGYTVTKNVQVGGTLAVEAIFNSSATTVQTQENITFTSSTDAASYTWDFGDGNTGTGKTASHSYLAEGVYNVKLTVTSEGGCSSTAMHPVTVTSSVATGIGNVQEAKIHIWSHDNIVYVDFSSQAKVEAEIDIYNVIGQQLSHEKFGKSNIYTRQIANIDAGYLMVKVKNDNAITTKKVFIVNK